VQPSQETSSIGECKKEGGGKLKNKINKIKGILINSII
jgi:hypothetical protein